MWEGRKVWKKNLPNFFNYFSIIKTKLEIFFKRGCVCNRKYLGDLPTFDFFSFSPPYEMKNIKVFWMSSNLVRFQKISNQAFAENFTCLSFSKNIESSLLSLSVFPITHSLFVPSQNIWTSPATPKRNSFYCGTSSLFLHRFDDVIRFFQVSCNQWWCSNRSNHQNFFPEGFIVQWNNECTSLKKELKILIHILFY